jgi:hypothetical protein
LETARRHLRESEDRIARQEALIAGLIRDKHERLLPAASQLVETMQGYKASVTRHISELEETSRFTHPE